MRMDRIKLHRTVDRLREIRGANEQERDAMLAELVTDIEDHLDRPVDMTHAVVGLKRAHRRAFREGLIAMGLTWLFTACVTMVCGCFSESNGDPDTGTTTDTDSLSETSDEGTTTGPAETDDGGATGSSGGGTSTDDSETTTAQTSDGSTTGTEATESWTDGPYYGPCSELGGCDAIIEECLYHYNGNVCGASCETAADCPPSPEGQEVSCRNVDNSLPGEECVLVCTGSYDASTCPPPMHCLSVNGIHYCVYEP